MQQFLDPMTGRGPFFTRESEVRPNIFLISFDMVPFEFHGEVPGAPPMKTPNLDRLREGGVHFRHSYATAPLCSPSRASYLTGRYSYITTNSERSHDGHAIHLREDDTIFPEYLKASGYAVRHVGKSHVGTHKFIDVFGENDSPWDRWSPPWFDDDDYITYLRSRGLERISFSEPIRGVDASGGGAGAHYGGWIADQKGEGFPIDATYPFFLVDRTINKLESMDRGEAPLYLQLDFFGPHQPFSIPSGMEERRRELEELVEVPKSAEELLARGSGAPTAEPRVYSLYRKNWGLAERDTIRKYIIANILQYELMDMALGRLFDYLRSNGLYDDAWVFFLADHGEMNCRSLLVDKGAYLNPRVLRVPLYVKPPNGHGGVESRVVDEPVSLLDLSPTILELAGVDHGERADGVSFVPACTAVGWRRDEETSILAEVWNHVMPNPAVNLLVRADDGRLYQYTYNATDPVDELYDVESSSIELVNLIDDPRYAGVKELCLARLERVLAADSRWKSYLNFLRLEYAERFAHRGDRQHFERRV